MFWAVLVARVVLGLPFLVFGLNHFLAFLAPPPVELPEKAVMFATPLGTTGYMDVIKVLEVVGGLLVISGRLVPLGLVILTPVAVNILLFEIFLVGKAGPGLALTVMCVALIWSYRSHFAPLFAVKPRIG